uniref:Dystroglycan (inferred by orthology to a human protein) n=1 Tax=Strongyloides venezuelensis TaxID=75913 RepID=A0A0K0G2T9_STRVS
MVKLLLTFILILYPIIGLSIRIPHVLNLSVGQVADINIEGHKLHLDLTNPKNDHITRFIGLYENNLIILPQTEDIGSHYITLTGINTGINHNLKINVSKEKNTCGDHELEQLWLDILPDINSKDNLKKRGEAIKTLNAIGKGQVSNIRLFRNMNELNAARSMVPDTGDTDFPLDEPIITMKLACNDRDVSEVMDVMAEIDDIYSKAALMRGFMYFDENSKNSEIEITTVSSIRTTRKVDNPPVKVQSLQSYECKRGIICEIHLPKDLFIDAEDGDTTNLSLYADLADFKKSDSNDEIDRNPDNFMTVYNKSLLLIGVPIIEGLYNFRIIAKDKLGQSAAVPFSINVHSPGSYTHEYLLTLDKSVDRLLETPDVLIGFVKKISHAVGDKKDNHIMINNIIPKGAQSIVSWSNTTLNDVICHHKKIENILHTMVTPNGKRPLTRFIKAVGSSYHVRDVSLNLLSTCARKSPNNITGGNNADVTVTKEDDKNFISSGFFIPFLIAIVALFIFTACLMAIYVMVKIKSKDEKKSTDFISKGLPVVFPEEVSNDDTDVSVNTPMLIKEERAPLNVTLHDNPLYRIPLGNTGGARESSMMTGTSSASKSGQQSNVTAITSQRQPPPYIAP